MSRPGLTPIRRVDLAVLAVAFAVAARLLVGNFYGDVPPLHWWMAVPLGVLAVAEALGARTLRFRLDAERRARAAVRDPGRALPDVPVRPVEPMLVARVAVLAQASAYVGAGFTGAWIGVLAYVVPSLGRLESARGDTVTAALGTACAAALVGAALWLESVCRVPKGPDDERPGTGAPA